eukprot:TRINITY_DN61229_c0_g1_i2.p1 TRINITY_DN61229_c0_g1~~TRINITY_DN61229_c0_g1_i2.p1  ORF type:complete len:207 (+),score=65.19 TRINITY_DN61229_c0_g1_i2:95-622(+)
MLRSLVGSEMCIRDRMMLFESHADEILVRAKEKGIKVNLIASEPELLPKSTLNKLQHLAEQTEAYRCFTLNLCVSYGARSEIAGAAKKMAQAVAAGTIAADDITEQSLGAAMLTGGLPDPDLLIRTSEARLSNFLLWQLAYTEIQFVDKLWPEICQQDIRDAVYNYASRKRRFGK